MTDQSNIVAAEARFPLDRLAISDMNPRQSVSEAEIADLATSIWDAGMIQPMAGLADDQGGAAIVGGGRRLRALRHLQESHPDLATTRPDLAYPLVTLAPDIETARLWAGAENAARRALSPADEIEAFGKMARAGSSAVAIARAFAVSEPQVKQRLALANLPCPVIAALRDEQISVSGAAAFTVSHDESRSLEVLEQVRGRNYNAAQIKRMLQPDSVRPSDRRVRFVGMDAYEAAGGRVSRDLFSEDVVLIDTELLDDVFVKKATDILDGFEAEGWKWADLSEHSYVSFTELDKYHRLAPIPGDLSAEESARADELAELCEAQGGLDDAQEAEYAAIEAKIEGDYSAAQRAVGGVCVCIDFTGNVIVHKGLVDREDRAAAIEAGVLSAPSEGSEVASPEDAAPSPYSAKLGMDLRAIALGARQSAAVAQTDLILDLLAFQLSGGFGYETAFELRSGAPTNSPETQTGFALNDRLTKEGAQPEHRWSIDLDAFAAFRKRGRTHRDGELARHVARLLDVRDEALGDMIDAEAGTDLRAVWTPTAENFFSRMKADWLSALWNTLLDLSPDAPKATAFAKRKKGEKAQALEDLFAAPVAAGASETQAERIAAWVPDFFD